jgi:hypothetical protein
MVWISAYTANNQNVNVDSVTRILCPAYKETIVGVLAGLGIPASAITDTSLNGCAVVTPLPSPVGFVRVAYKYYLDVSQDQFRQVSNALYSAAAITSGHVMCGSGIFYQSMTSPAIDIHSACTPQTQPTWLGVQAAGTVCYNDVFAPIIG